MSTATNRPVPVLQPGPHLFDAEGPFVSVYLTTRGELPDAAEQVALRWRNLRTVYHRPDYRPSERR